MFALLQWGLWFAGAAIELFLLVELLRSRLFHQYPCLTAFFSWQVARIAPSMLAYGFSLASYQWVYWFSEIVSWGLSFLVILEIYGHSFEAYAGLRRLSRIFVSRVAAIFMAAVCLSLVFARVADPEPSQWVNNWLFLVHRSARIVQGSLLLALILFLGWFRLRAPLLARYLMLGLLADAVLQTVIASLRYELGPQLTSVLSVAASAFYILILGTWYWALRKCRAGEGRDEVPVVLPDSSLGGLVLGRVELVNASLVRAFRE